MNGAQTAKGTPVGMHHGIIAADVSIDRLVDAINNHTSTLVPGEIHATLGEIDLGPRDEGWPMAIGERDSKCYLFDTSLVLSTGHDLIPALSADLAGATVVGAGAETTSGSYWLFVARHGETIRSYWNSYSDMRQPWTRGVPLPSEARQPLEDLDGDGILAALASLGLDFGGWVRTGPYRVAFYTAERFPEPGPHSGEFSAFHESVKFPEGQQPKPTVVEREGGYDIVPGGSPLAKAAKPAKRGLLGLFRRK